MSKSNICRVSIFMSKSDKGMSSFHIYVEKRGKLKYICPNYNIYIQIVIYVTLHGKTGKKAMTRARVRWHGTLSVTYDTYMRI